MRSDDAMQEKITCPLAESNDATQNVITESTEKPLSGVMPLSCSSWMMI
jgi:hypothetical protein